MNIDLGAALNDAWSRVGGWIEGLVNSLPNIVAAIVIIVVFWILAAVVRRGVRHAVDRVSRHRDLNRLLGALAFGGVFAIGFFIALGILELDGPVKTLLAGAGIIGLALGFAFQDIAENFISGILMMLRRPFRDGDIIETGDFIGTVDHINMRATILRTFQGQMVILPNSEVFKNPITNFSQAGTRRVDVAVGVSYGDDLEKVRRVATQAIESMEGVLREKPVELFYEEFGGSSINFQIRFWIDFDRWPDFLRARSEAIMRIKRAFDENDITIPFPITTLDFSEIGGETLAKAWPGRGGTPGGGGSRA